jgi:hypothetical protein
MGTAGEKLGPEEAVPVTTHSLQPSTKRMHTKAMLYCTVWTMYIIDAFLVAAVV